ncbi:hypothetical protein ACFQ1E_09980 [Sphingomonas canadensis]|uniref:Uncharacterized protein n=1 Tax=Sphingomonas canadensis TaxID=1219257 RepID=A0ABW3H790_9SPHN|nr:hypothetical protein [Sphingomonas canadensis]MCW3836552.1 hypothetical protein [Sphingomonas canadensis]
MIRAAILLGLAAIALAGCGSDSDPGPGGVTAGEARQLDAAAAATDINAIGANDTEDAR